MFFLNKELCVSCRNKSHIQLCPLLLQCLEGSMFHALPLEQYLVLPQGESFFAWTATWRKILTFDNLIKRGNVLVGWCYMSLCSGETVYHLLLHCTFAFDMRSFTFRSVASQWILPERLLNSCLDEGIGSVSIPQIFRT